MYFCIETWPAGSFSFKAGNDTPVEETSEYFQPIFGWKYSEQSLLHSGVYKPGIMVGPQLCVKKCTFCIVFSFIKLEAIPKVHSCTAGDVFYVMAFLWCLSYM